MAPRFTTYHLTIVSFLIFCSIWIFHLKPNSEHPQEKQVHILILSSWRSGSSFLGQIFNHHPNVFYIYEPARLVWVKFPHENAGLLHYPIRDLLRSLFTCDMSPLHHYLPQGGRSISELPFWSESRALCSPPACTAFSMDEQYNRPACFQRCGYVPLEKMTQSCKVHQHVVLKTVRVLDLNVLLPLLQDSNLALRVIHLVRDPRAVAFSRMSFNYLEDEDLIMVRENERWENEKAMPNVTQVMANVCNAQVAINEYSRKAGISSHGQYMMVRLEDLANEPLSMVEKIYNFAGLRLTADIQKWLYNITHQSSPSQMGFMNFAEDSRKIIQKWRGGLKHSIVLEIQDKCRKAMEVFGYRQVGSTKEQQDLTLSVMTGGKD